MKRRCTSVPVTPPATNARPGKSNLHCNRGADTYCTSTYLLALAIADKTRGERPFDFGGPMRWQLKGKISKKNVSPGFAGNGSTATKRTIKDRDG
ncbi:hypothetical protein NPIL_500201 [Nephila pilipes]|uniref:Uncharacterized protein n=1 Tax=Nephila pilipes TaxID=299642 RepID=A0A8X6TY39_NEPPI|nr:hypothetical protein NPIL_500201 [Nephila pilipes]